MKIKIICGHRPDQQHSIPADEAHKAFFLFLNPSERGLFANGLALIGADIRRIEPDYHGTMGWNPAHQLDSDDWNELRAKGIEEEIRHALTLGKQVAQQGDRSMLNKPLSALSLSHTPEIADDARKLAASMTV